MQMQNILTSGSFLRSLIICTSPLPQTQQLQGPGDTNVMIQTLLSFQHLESTTSLAGRISPSAFYMYAHLLIHCLYHILWPSSDCLFIIHIGHLCAYFHTTQLGSWLLPGCGRGLCPAPVLLWTPSEPLWLPGSAAGHASCWAGTCLNHLLGFPCSLAFFFTPSTPPASLNCKSMHINQYLLVDTHEHFTQKCFIF